MEFLIKRNVPLYEHKKHWQFCVGSGHAALALRTDYTEQLKFIHDQLGIERVRFHGIFHDDMGTRNHLGKILPIPGAEQYTEQSFHACGIAYDNVLKAGMKPFVELSFMPGDLAAKETQGMFYYKPNIAPPLDYEKWTAYIQDFVRYLIHRYGQDEVRTWYFEVWNEPDLNVAFFAGTRDEYFRLYEVTAKAIKEVDEKIQVGGPATSGSKWVSSFLKYCEMHQVPVDFVSTHQYAGDPLGGVEDQGDMEAESTADGADSDIDGLQAYMMMLAQQLKNAKDKSCLNGFRALMPDKSETEDIPNDVFAYNSALVRKQAMGLPVFYTEWNENATFSAYTNDTRKVAAYDIKTALDVAGNVDGSSIWCFSDLFEEMHQFPQQFHGGFGMLTIDGIPKPVFYGLKMLAMAADQRMDLGADATNGEIGIAGFESAHERQILLFRQKMKNLDLPKEQARVIIEMEAEPKQVLAYRIDEDHCNPLKEWENMGCPLDMNRREIENIKNKTAMTEEKWPFCYKDHAVQIQAELGVNDIYFFRMIR